LYFLGSTPRYAQPSAEGTVASSTGNHAPDGFNSIIGELSNQL